LARLIPYDPERKTAFLAIVAIAPQRGQTLGADPARPMVRRSSALRETLRMGHGEPAETRRKREKATDNEHGLFSICFTCVIHGVMPVGGMK
jgi:hypothetical protein